MNGKQLLLFIATLFTSVCHAQYIHGYVKDSQTLQTLPGANIISSSGEGTVSDEKGLFELNISSQHATLTVSFVGYHSNTFDISFIETDTLFVKILLTSETESLGEVVVSASTHEQRLEEVTVSLDVISPKLAKDKNLVKMEDVLKQAPGVVMTDKTANIRSGSGWSYGTGTRVQTLVDYMPLISGDAAQSQWDLVPLFSAESTEIMKGASSVLYGSAAMNGVIHLLTHPKPTQQALSVNVFSGFYDDPDRKELKWWDKPGFTSGANFDLQQPISEQTGFVLSGSYINDQGFRYLEEEERTKFFAKYFYTPNKIKRLELSLAANISYADNGDALLWQNDSLGYIPLDSSITQNKGWDFYIDPVITYRHSKLKHALRNRYLRLNNNSKSKDADYTNWSDQYFSQYTLQYFVSEKLVLTGGLSASQTVSNSVVFQGRHTSANQATFLQADAKPWDWLNLNFGMRYENASLDDLSYSKPVFRGGLSVAILPGTHLRASYGEAFRFPAISETYISTALGPISIYPNPDLKPETGYTYEGGLRQMFRLGALKGYVDAAIFSQKYDNMMEYTFGNWGKPGTITGLGFKALNVGSTTINGIEISTAIEGKIHPKIEYRLLAGYTYTNPISDHPSNPIGQDNNGNDLTYINSSSDTSGYILKYRYQHIAKADLQLNLWKWRTGFSMRYNSFMQNIDEAFNVFITGVEDYRNENPDGNLICDFRLGYQFTKKVQADVLVNNLFNEELLIRPGFLGPPRSYSLRLNYSF